jgi:hypothetical protein
MKADILVALKHVAVFVILFLVIFFIGKTESNVAMVLTGAAIGVGGAFGAAALEDKKVSPAPVICWGIIGLLAGIGFAIAL